MTNYKRIDSILQAEWTEAAAAGDAERLMILRAAFEANELEQGDEPVLVRDLTGNQIHLADDCYPDGNEVLASGSTWALFKDRTAIEDILIQEDDLIDDSVMRAICNVNMDLTEAQEAFTTRAATRSITSLCRKLKKAVR